MLARDGVESPPEMIVHQHDRRIDVRLGSIASERMWEHVGSARNPEVELYAASCRRPRGSRDPMLDVRQVCKPSDVGMVSKDLR